MSIKPKSSVVGRIVAIRHLPHEPTDLVTQWLIEHGYDVIVCSPAHGDPLPDAVDSTTATVVFGGAQSSNDPNLDYLDLERNWIEKNLSQHRPVLGICLGAQLLTQVLGGEVRPRTDGKKEIGWSTVYPVETEPHPLIDTPKMFYQWHGEGFTVPTSARLMATGEMFENQGFVYGDNTIGVQFHPEVTADIIATWIKDAGHEIDQAGTQTEPAGQHIEQAHRRKSHSKSWIDALMRHWTLNFESSGREHALQ